MGELVKSERGLTLSGFTLSPTGMVPDGKPTYEQWEVAGKSLRYMEGSVHWWIGDWLNYGERSWGEKYSQALEATGFDYQTLRNDKWVAEQIELSRRRDNLPWSHHAEVAALPPKQQDKWLAKADKEGWTRSELRQALQEERQVIALEKAGEMPEGKYRVLYADPPWQYADQRTGGIESGAASAHYPQLPTEEICVLSDAAGVSVRERVATDAVLFLWATAPCLPDAIQVMEAWGFTYKAQFIWDKVRGFNGHYNDVCHELLLIGLKGSCQPRSPELRKSVVRCEKTKHSRKPDLFYEIIEEMYPLNPAAHLELFARRQRDGWVSWGNEA